MCGIFGIVVSKEQPLGTILTEAGQRLSYRGYDSVGCATIADKGAIDLRKDVGKVDDVAQRLRFAEMKGRRGMVQLRWATFGHPSTANAQPHLDSDGDLVGAHNGNVVNNVELRQQFIDEGMTVRSTNDGESCVHAVERYLDRGHEMIEAIRHAYGDLEGDYAFVVGRKADDRLYALKKGSGLVIGLARRRDLHLVGPAVDPAADAAHRPRPRRRDRHPLARSRRDPPGRGRAPGRARARGDHRDHGRGHEGRLRPLHAQGDPRAAGGRRRSCCTWSSTPGTSARWPSG